MDDPGPGARILPAGVDVQQGDQSLLLHRCEFGPRRLCLYCGPVLLFSDPTLGKSHWRMSVPPGSLGQPAICLFPASDPSSAEPPPDVKLVEHILAAIWAVPSPGSTRERVAREDRVQVD